MKPRLSEDHLNDNVLLHARHDFVRILLSQTVGEALASVRQDPIGGRIVYFYVVDDDNRLQGVVPTRRLLLNHDPTPVRSIMVSSVITLPTSATLLDACELFTLHRLLAFPIVDADRHLAGVVDVELYTQEISDLARREESDDLFQLIGLRMAALQKASLGKLYRSRFPWLLCNLAGGTACALLVGSFQAVLEQVVVLALFIPLVLTLAESVSIQSLTLCLQSHAGNRIPVQAVLRNVLREIPVALALGASCGGLVALVALLWKGEMAAAASIWLSICASVMLAALIGRVVPMFIRFVQRDPKVASGPIVLALTDLATLFSYLGLATWLLR